MSSAANNLRGALTDVEQVERERNKAEREVCRLAKANDEMCDELFEARRRIAELEAELASTKGAVAA